MATQINGKDFILDSFLDINLNAYAELPIIVVYDHPKDYPDKYVARLMDLKKGTKFIILRDSLDEIQDHIPLNMTRFKRSEWDKPEVVESWL